MTSPIILTLNLMEDSILLNEGVLAALDWPRQVQILINQVEIPAERVEQFEISGRALLKKIRHMVGWEDDLPRLCYGEYLPAHQAIRFDLTEAEPVELAE